MQGKTDKQRKHSMMFMGVAMLGIGTMILALTISNMAPASDIRPPGPNYNYWVPTADDIAYQDSMYSIIQNTQSDMDTINQGMERIILKLDVIIYENGLSDSIKLFDQKHVDAWEHYMNKDGIGNDEEHMWIGGNGDTIYE